MIYPRVFVFLALAILRLTLACETECKNGVTGVFVGNYSMPIRRVFLKIVGHLIDSTLSFTVQLWPCQQGERIADRFLLDQDPQYYLEPINNTLHDEAPDLVQNAIFSRFHGKCQDVKTGINPVGCPNPSCPVICGTPGSLVYHYSELETIVHNAVKALLEQAVNPSSVAYSESSSRIYRAYQSSRMVGPSLRFPLAHGSATYKTADEYSFNRTLSVAFRDIASLLDSECGGPRKDTPDPFPQCSWKKTMVNYILTFP